MKCLLLAVLVPFIQTQQQPFYANRLGGESLIDKIRIDDYHGPGKDLHPEVDANEIIGNFMNPLVEMYDSMQENYKARQYAERVQRERDESPLTSSKSLFELFERLQRPTTTTTPQPPLIERILKPYVEPWQKQFGYLTEDMANILHPTTTTTTQAPVTEKKSLLEKAFAAFIPSLRQKTTPAPVVTTTPSWFDPEYLERLLFHKDRKKRQVLLFATDPKPDVSKPLEVANPFTPNPLMAMFTMKPIPALNEFKVEAKPIHDPASLPLIRPTFKMQDPFYNPLFPNRKSKFFDLLAGGDAVRILG